MSAKCFECLKPMPDARRNRKFCSGACRSKAYYKRKRDEKGFQKAAPKRRMIGEIDAIRMIAPHAAKALEKMSIHAGKGTMDLAIKAVFDALLQASSLNFDFDKGEWEHV